MVPFLTTYQGAARHHDRREKKEENTADFSTCQNAVKHHVSRLDTRVDISPIFGRNNILGKNTKIVGKSKTKPMGPSIHINGITKVK